MSQRGSLSESEDKFNREQKRSALDEVLASETFARADQLRRFLRYICEMQIAGRSQEISEYSIATEALGRAAGYIPGDDSSVRSRAHALRQKLQDFYMSERTDSPIQIELRKGTYTPLFTDRSERRRPVETTPIPVLAPDKPAPHPPAIAPRGWLFGFAAGVLAASLAAGAWVYLRPASMPKPSSILQEAWGPVFNPNAEVVVCVGSPPALLLKTFKNGTLPQVPRLMPTPKEVSDWYAGLHEMDGGGDLYMQTTMNSVLSGDALAAARAVRFLSGFGVRVQVLPEWGLRPLALRGRNLLIIGSPNYSQYAGRVLRNTPFSVRYETTRREEVISDGPAEAVSTKVYRPKRDDFGELTQVYGLLTVLPGQATGDGREQIAIFSGITSAGPQAAMEFFSSTDSLTDLKRRFAKEGYRHLPPAYQVVIRCGVDRALALSWAYEAHRVIEHPPSFE